MVNMLLSNEKLVDRGVKMVMGSLSLDSYDEAKNLLLKYGSVKKAVEAGTM
jgi:N-acetylmuramic acid 6-phosphate etherase